MEGPSGKVSDPEPTGYDIYVTKVKANSPCQGIIPVFSRVFEIGGADMMRKTKKEAAAAMKELGAQVTMRISVTPDEAGLTAFKAGKRSEHACTKSPLALAMSITGTNRNASIIDFLTVGAEKEVQPEPEVPHVHRPPLSPGQRTCPSACPLSVRVWCVGVCTRARACACVCMHACARGVMCFDMVCSTAERTQVPITDELATADKIADLKACLKHNADGALPWRSKGGMSLLQLACVAGSLESVRSGRAAACGTTSPMHGSGRHCSLHVTFLSPFPSPVALVHVHVHGLFDFCFSLSLSFRR